MNKLGFVLALYAAGVATWLLLRPAPEPVRQSASAERNAPQATFDRRVMTEARTFLRTEIRPVLSEVEARFARLQELQDRMGDELQRAQELAEVAKRAQHDQEGRLAERLDVVSRTGVELGEGLATQAKRLAALIERVQAVEDRPVAEPAGFGPAPTPTRPPEPKRPTRPPFPSDAPKAPDPGELMAALKQARAHLQADDLQSQVLGIEAMRKHRVMEAVPRLIELVATSRHDFARQAAAAALGELEAADAVKPLTDALIDSNVLLAQQAYRSLRQITAYDPGMSPTARIRERRKTRGEILAWWRTNEANVRERLGQPGGEGS